MSLSALATPGTPQTADTPPMIEADDALTSTSANVKTRVCKDCRDRKPQTGFPADKYGRADTRMCLQCVDENTPLLMTETEIAKWLGVTIAEVRTWPTAGDYAPPGKAAIPLYSRMAVTEGYLPPGWRAVFGWTAA